MGDVGVQVRTGLFPDTVLTRRPRTPGAPTAVDGIREYRALGNLLMPMIRQMVLLRSRGALHQMLVPAAVRFLSVQASLTAAMSMALSRRYSVKNHSIPFVFQIGISD